MERLCVFCGSNPGDNKAYRTAAEELGTALYDRDITLVYGGSKLGTMGTVARNVLNRGGKAVGVVPKELLAREQAFIGLTELKAEGFLSTRARSLVLISDGVGQLLDMLDGLEHTNGIQRDGEGRAR